MPVQIVLLVNGVGPAAHVVFVPLPKKPPPALINHLPIPVAVRPLPNGAPAVPAQPVLMATAGNTVDNLPELLRLP